MVSELASLGLSPSVLHTLLQSDGANVVDNGKGKQRALGERPEELLTQSGTARDDWDVHPSPKTKAVYEVIGDGEHLRPRLRIWVRDSAIDGDDRLGQQTQNSDSNGQINVLLGPPDPALPSDASTNGESSESVNDNEDLLLVANPIVSKPGQSLIWTLQRRGDIEEGEDIVLSSKPGNSTESLRNDFASVLYPAEVLSKQ